MKNNARLLTNSFLASSILVMLAALPGCGGGGDDGVTATPAANSSLNAQATFSSHA